jgi:CHAT domain-containing protein
MAALTKELQTLTAEYKQVQSQIRSSRPRYAALTQPQPLDLREIQSLLDADTMLLEYFLGDDHSYLWAVTPTTMRSYKLPKRREINDAARQVYELLIARNLSGGAEGADGAEGNETQRQENRRIAQADAQFAAAAGKLSRMVLAPVAQQLGKKRLVIVAQGALQYVPFGALPVGSRQSAVGSNGRRTTSNNRPLIADHEIINLPSASTLAVLRREVEGRKPAAKTLAVFADPVFDLDDERIAKITIKAGAPAEKQKKGQSSSEQTRRLKHITEQFGSGHIPRLPFTRQEADQILGLVPETERKAALDFAANRASVTADDLKQYRIIHFATHGLINSQQPELSSIVLSLVDEKGEPQEGFLRLHEIYGLNLPAEVVVLSACETGLGKEIKGEGLVGLTRGFMYAGAPRVVVSLWAVNDRATSELMAKFYQKMLKENLRPAAALRAAQVEMSKDRRWNNPYYWAAFSLQGEWR